VPVCLGIEVISYRLILWLNFLCILHLPHLTARHAHLILRGLITEHGRPL